ncbi:ferric reductase-like transmembrane domain-containing protein [Kangsaoukella pontilimi]|uniref:ferric reductase-like transmembrane domain-containing protein n=1 Tax=Kangsaoukella pontilimi TaxID=2691042 RepID=UPI0029C9C5E4|nr:ferric reductase-like transmembrane domain-containing protein [Kangsaoukella pontilimi]
MAANSPLLAWRDPIYIAGGFAGIAALALLLLQPLLVAGLLPGAPRAIGRKIHLWSGLLLVVSVVLHVAGLWATSPPDVTDALLFRSPTPFAVWGVLAMWAVFGAAVLGLGRKRLALPPRIWRIAHAALVTVVVVGSVLHAVQIEGAMGSVTKLILCGAAVLALGAAFLRLRSWAAFQARTASGRRS